jgi:hypothetical protein
VANGSTAAASPPLLLSSFLSLDLSSPAAKNALSLSLSK